MDYSHKQRRHSRTSLSNYLKLAIEIYPLRKCPNPHCVDVLTLWPMVIGLTLSLSEYISNIQNYVAPPPQLWIRTFWMLIRIRIIRLEKLEEKKLKLVRSMRTCKNEPLIVNWSWIVYTELTALEGRRDRRGDRLWWDRRWERQGWTWDRWAACRTGWA